MKQRLYTDHQIEQAIRTKMFALQNRFPGVNPEQMVNKIMGNLREKNITGFDSIQIAVDDAQHFVGKNWKLLATGAMSVVAIVGGVLLYIKFKHGASGGLGITDKVAGGMHNGVRVIDSAKRMRQLIRGFEKDAQAENVKWGNSVWGNQAVDADFKSTTENQGQGKEGA